MICRNLLVGLAFAAGFSTVSYAKTILMIESYHKEYDWDANVRKGFEAVAGKDNKIEFFEMDTKRLPPDQHAAQADKAFAKFEEIKPDIVVLADDAALKFLGKKIADKGTPVIFTAINGDPRSHFAGTMPANVTGILERPLLNKALKLVKDMVPTTKKILIFFDEGITAEATKNDPSFAGGKDQVNVAGVTADIKLIGQWSKWQEMLKTGKDYDAIIGGLYQTVKDGTTPVDPDKVLTTTVAEIGKPVFCFWDFCVGEGKGIGGYVLAGESMGRKAGEMVNKVFAGTPPNKQPMIVNDEGIYLFNKKALEASKLTLPKSIESKVQYK